MESVNGRVTRSELAEKLHETMGLSRAECSRLVELVLQEMCDALSRGENVKLSAFGTFLLRDKALRQGRNPRTGDAVPIRPRRVLTFRASQELRERIARGS